MIKMKTITKARLSFKSLAKKVIKELRAPKAQKASKVPQDQPLQANKVLREFQERWVPLVLRAIKETKAKSVPKVQKASKVP